MAASMVVELAQAVMGIYFLYLGTGSGGPDETRLYSQSPREIIQRNKRVVIL